MTGNCKVWKNVIGSLVGQEWQIFGLLNHFACLWYALGGQE